MRSISLTRPDDWHVHLRDGHYLKHTVADIARYFARALVMPNLVPPIDSPELAKQYHDNIVSLVPKGTRFRPLMTLYITPNTQVETVIKAKQSGLIYAFKLYPVGVTTHSEAGVLELISLFPIFEAMQEHGMPLCIHGEVTQPSVDIFDREAAFIDAHLADLVQRFPALKVIFEHITTSEAVDFVMSCDNHVAATITAHHLLFNRNDMLAGGMRPLYYCLPVLKRDKHQAALIQAASSGDQRFFLGTDSAPHPRSAKENACGCAAGSYTAHAALELYTEVFDRVGALDKLEAFASFNGPDFYALPRNTDKIELVEEAWQVPKVLPFGEDQLIPIKQGELIHWRIKENL